MTIVYVSDEASLRKAIERANNGGVDTIEIGSLQADGSVRPVSIALTADLPVLSGFYTIKGNGSTISGGYIGYGDDGTPIDYREYRGFSTFNARVEIDDLNIVDTAARGGAGGESIGGGGAGGGGGGLGGGLFVSEGSYVTINNVNFNQTEAVGGEGGYGVLTGGGGGGGGGGMGGDGGTTNSGQGAGGGGIGVGATGGTNGGNGAAGTANPNVVGSAASGSNKETSYGFLVYTYTYTNYGSNGGAGAGGGGYGAGGGGGGGGILSQYPGTKNGGSYGVALNFSSPNFLIDLTALIASVVAPEFAPAIRLAATAATVAYGVTAYFVNKYEGDVLHKYTTFYAGYGGGSDAHGTGVPGVLGAGVGKASNNKLNALGFGIGISLGGGGSDIDGGMGGVGGGGGGGGANSYGGVGGFGGGGGGSGSDADYDSYGSVSGGFGGGGGSSGSFLKTNSKFIALHPGANGSTGFGGGAASYDNTGTVKESGGGGGLGAGGAVFVQAGGTLIDESSTETDTSVSGGKGGLSGDGRVGSAGDGLGVGHTFFLQGGAALTMAPLAGETVAIGDVSDVAGTPDKYGRYSDDIIFQGIPINRGEVDIEGHGTVQLTGANTYLGGTWLNANLLTPDYSTFTNGKPGLNTGGATLEITAGTTLFGGIYVYGQAIDADAAPATLIIDAGETVDRSIVIVNDQTWDPTYRVEPGYTASKLATPLIVDLTRGGTFTGQILGLAAGQTVEFLGGVYLGAVPGTGASGATFKVAVQKFVFNNAAAQADDDYAQATIVTGLLAETLTVTVNGAAQFDHLWAGTSDALAQTLTWLSTQSFPAVQPTIEYNDLTFGPAPVEIAVDGQLSDSIDLGDIVIPTLPVALVIENNGGSASADGSVNANLKHAHVTLSGGIITLNAATALTFSGGAYEHGEAAYFGPKLEVESSIVGDAGAHGLTTTGLVTLSGDNTFTGALHFNGILELTSELAVGGGGALDFVHDFINDGARGLSSDDYLLFRDRMSAELKIDGTTLPANEITHFESGDLIDLVDIAPPVTGYVYSDRNGDLRLGDEVLHFADPLGALLPFYVIGDGAGGTDIVSQVFTAHLDPQSAYAPLQQFLSAIAYLDFFAGRNTAFPSNYNTPIKDVAVDFGADIVNASATPAIYASAGHDFFLNGAGHSLTESGPLIFASANAYVDDLTLISTDANAVTVEAGASVVYDDVNFTQTGTGEASTTTILSGGTLTFQSGVIGGVQADDDSTLIFAPGQGQTAYVRDSFAAGVGSGVYIGDPYALTDGAASMIGGFVNLFAGYIAYGLAPDIVTDTTVDFVGVEGFVTFDSPVGGVARIEGPYASATLYATYNQALGEIDLPGVSVYSPQVVTLDGNGRLAIQYGIEITGDPGIFGFDDGYLQISGVFGGAASFLVAPDGGHHARLIPMLQSTSITSGVEFDALMHYVATLPGDDGLEVDVRLANTLTLTTTSPDLAPAGVNLRFTDGASAGGFALASGATATLNGDNSFSGGVTLQTHTALFLDSADAAGAGGVIFAGGFSELHLSAAGLNAPITGMLPTDFIHVDGVVETQTQSSVTVDASGHLALGAVTLDLPDLANVQLLAIADGTAGVFLSRPTSVSLRDDSGGSATDGLTNDASLRGVSAPGGFVQLSIDNGAETATVLADSSGNWSYSPSLSDGAHSVSAVTQVLGGLAYNSAQTDFTLLATAPTVKPVILAISPDTGVSSDDGYADTGAISIGGTAGANGVVTVFDGANVIGDTTTDANGNWYLTLAAPLGDGKHALSAAFADAAGNADLTVSDPFVATIITSAPQLALVVRLDPPGATHSEATAINASGEVVGWFTGADGVQHGFAESGGVFEILDPSDSAGTTPESINANGAVVGEYFDASGVVHGFLYSGGVFTTLDPSGALQTDGLTINDAGAIAGRYVSADGHSHAFLYANGGYTTLDPAGSLLTESVGLNGDDEVLGTYEDASGATRGFLYQNVAYTALDAPGASTTTPAAIDSAGDVVGAFDDAIGEHGFLYQGGAYTVLDAPGATSTRATGLNGAGEVLGTYADASGQHSFVWSNGVFTPVDAPAAATTKLQGLNGAGQAVGYVKDAFGVHAAELTPAFAVTTRRGTHTLAVGETVTITMHLSEAVNVTGRPELLLNNNQVASYVSGDGGANLTFQYTVAGGGATADLQVTGLAPGGGSIADFAGNPLSGAVQGDLGLQVTAPPRVAATVAALDPPGSDDAIGNAINAAGEIVGQYTDSGGQSHGFSEIGGVFTTIDPSGSAYTNAESVNAQGEIAGDYQDGAGVSHGFVWSAASGFATLDPASSIQTDNLSVNDSGAVAGRYILSDGQGGGYSYGFLYTAAGGYMTLQPNGALFTEVSGIDDAGDVVGDFVSSDGAQHGFLYQNGAYTTFDPPGGGLTSPHAINAQGAVVGDYTDGGGVEDGFVYASGAFTTLAAPGADWTSATAINGLGEVFGSYGDATGRHGFGWSAGVFTTLDGPGASSTQLNGANDAGQATGYLHDARGEHAAEVSPAVRVTTSNGATQIGAGDSVTFVLNLTEPVILTGAPTLTLSNGAAASYVGGSGGNQLTFAYSPVPGEATTDLQITGLVLNGGTLADVFGNPLEGGVTDDTGVSVLVAPGLAGVARRGETLSSIGAYPSSVAYQWLESRDGGATFAALAGATRSTYQLQKSDEGARVEVEAFVGGATLFSAPTVAVAKAALPVVVSVAASGAGIDGAGNGVLGAGAVVKLTVAFSEAVTVSAGGKPTLRLSNAASAAYSGRGAGNTLMFTYITAPGQNTLDLAVTGLVLNGAAIRDVDGQDLTLPASAIALPGDLKIDAGPKIVRLVNGAVATVNYNADGSLRDIAYAHVSGAAYTSYDVVYGANGKPASATYDNGRSTTWSYNADGSVLDVAYGGFSGAYASYDVMYGANGKPASAIFSNGMTEAFAYGSDGALQSTLFAHVPGAAYVTREVDYDSAGAPTRVVTTNSAGALGITGRQNGLTIDVGAASATIVGGGQGETFVFGATIGHDLITDFASRLSSASPDAISLPGALFGDSIVTLMRHTAFNAGGATIAFAPGETLRLPGLTSALMTQHQGAFVFHA